MSKAAKIISDAIVGNDFRTVIVAGKAYTIYPPTIHRLAGAISCLSEVDIEDNATVKQLLLSLKDTPVQCANALSWFIGGDESLSVKLSEGTYDDVVDALCDVFSLVSTEVFLKAVTLARNVASLAAKPK